jgi:CheY-like chemotaxis protein
MKLRSSDTASLLARTFGLRAPLGALALFGGFAAWDAPLAGTTAAVLLLLARCLRAAAQADDERRALRLEVDHLDASLRVAQQDNTALDAAFARFRDEAADAAHDECAQWLRRAQSRLVPYLQALGDALEADQASHFAGPLRCAAASLTLAAQDALDNTEPADRTIVFDEEAVDVRELIDGIALLVTPGATRKPLRLQVCIDRSVAARVLIDRARFGQVVLHLLAYAIDTAGVGVVTLAARAESLNMGAQRIVIGINGASRAADAAASQPRRARAYSAVAQAPDTREHPELALARVIARKMGGDITILEGRNVGVCVAFHAPLTIERHEWPVREHERRWAIVDIEAYEDRQAICELLKKLGVTTLPSDAKPPVPIDFRFADSRKPSAHGEKLLIVVTRDMLPRGVRERDGITELSLNPLSWTALRQVCGARASALPVPHAVHAAPVPAPVHAPVRASDAQPVVLIADDNEVNRKVLARQLDVLGYGRRVASSGDEALTLLGREPIDLLITDLQMPGMSGVELARHVKAAFGASGRALPMILLSANPDAKLTGDDRAMFGAVLIKTSGMSALKAALERLLPASATAGAARLESHDFTTLDSLAEQGVDVDSLLCDWQRSMQSDLADLQQRRDAGDDDGTRRALHKLAGAVGIVGNRGLMNALQRASAAHDGVDTALLDGLVARMHAQMSELDRFGERRKLGQ